MLVRRALLNSSSRPPAASRCESSILGKRGRAAVRRPRCSPSDQSRDLDEAMRVAGRRAGASGIRGAPGARTRTRRRRCRAGWSRCYPSCPAPGPCPRGLPSSAADAVREGSVELAEQIRDAARRGGTTLQPDDVGSRWRARARWKKEMPLGQPYSFEAQPPALAAFGGIAEAENELRALTRAFGAALLHPPGRGRAHPPGAEPGRGRAGAPRRGVFTAAEVASPSVRCAMAWSRPPCGSPCCPAGTCSAAALAPGRRAGPGAGRFLPQAAIGIVVHEDHGVGRFPQLASEEVGGVVRDYLHLDLPRRRPPLRPARHVGKVTATSAPTARRPRCRSSAASRGWFLRTRARTAVRELAGELLALYARRASEERSPAVPAGRRMGGATRRQRSPSRRRTTSCGSSMR